MTLLSPKWSALLVGLLPAVFACAAACAAEGPAPAAGLAAPVRAEVRFRRVLAPADRLSEWPLGRVRYLRMEPEQFEALVRTGGTPAAQPGAAGAFVAAAHYEARLVDGRLLSGRATLEVDSSGPTPAILALEPCNLAVRSATWNGSSTQGRQADSAESNQDAPASGNAENAQASAPTENTSRPPMLGFGPVGGLAVHVEEPGSLQFEWSRRGRTGFHGSLEFVLNVPRCPANTWVLELPERYVPYVDEGLVLDEGTGDKGTGDKGTGDKGTEDKGTEDKGTEDKGTEDKGTEDKGTEDKGTGDKGTEDKGTEDENVHRWRLELGGRTEVNLRLSPTGQLPEPGGLVRESAVYEISQNGLLLDVDFALEVHQEPLRQLTLSWEGPLQLVGISAADQPARWTTMPAQGKRRAAVVELPDPWQQTAALLRVRALAALKLERPWRLPRIELEGMAWQEGVANVRVVSPLVVQQVTLDRCRQTAAEALGSQPRGESLQFQYFAPDAGIEVDLAEQRSAPEILSGTSVEVREEETTARVVAELTAGDEIVSSLEAEVAPQWLIQAVESVPPEALDDWVLERDGSGRRRLSFVFARPLTSGQPLRIVVNARQLRWPLSQPLGLQDLVPLHFRGSPRSRHLVAVQAAEPYELELAAAEPLRLLSPEQLDPGEQALFAEPPSGLLFEDDPQARSWQVILRKQQAGYDGAIEAAATVEGDRLHEQYVLRITPRGGRVERVRVRFFPAKQTPPRFQLGAGSPNGPSLRAVLESPQPPAPACGSEETWELVLPGPREEPFEIRASREEQIPDRRPLSLAWLPDAVNQQARLTVRADSPERIRTRNLRLEPTVAPPPKPGQYSTVCAAYRFEPGRHGTDAAVEVVRVSRTAAVPAWVWNAQLQSWYHLDGHADHVATYWVEAAGRSDLRLRLPASVPGVRVKQVRIDRQPAVWRTTAGPQKDGPSTEASQGEELSCESQAGDELSIELPRGRRFPVVEVWFTTAEHALGPSGRLTAPVLPIESPVLAQTWSVWLPPGYRALDAEGGPQWPECSSLGIRQRLFGPLARPQDQAPADPLRPSTCVPVVQRWQQRGQAADRARAWLEAVGRRVPRPGEAAAGDFGRLFAASRLGSVGLLIDARAMDELGLRPGQPVPLVAGATARNRGTELLRQHDLSLLVGDQVLVLTSRRFAALLRRWLDPLRLGSVFWVKPGSLAKQLAQAASGGGEGGLVPADRWPAASRSSLVPWPGLGAAQMSDGWTLCQVAVSAGAPAELAYVHSDSVRLWAWIAFLVIAGTCWWLGRLHPRRLFWILAGTMCAALLMPEPAVVLATGATLGGLFCCALCLARAAGWGPCAALRTQTPSPADSTAAQTARAQHAPNNSAQGPSPENPNPENRGPDGSSTAKYVARLLMLAVFCGSAGRLGAAEDSGNPAEGSPPVYQVFIPIDENRQPTGDRYFVPEPLYRELFRRRAGTAEGVPPWLLGSAVYRGVLSRDGLSGKMRIDELKASFALRVFAGPAHVRIPFRRSGAGLLPDGALLDGRLVQMDWEPGGQALVFDVPQAGEYRLELALRPVTYSAASGGGFDLAIPRLAGSRLELVLPAGSPLVEVPSALGAVSRQPAPPQVIADLGPSEWVSVRWPPANHGALEPAADVEQLIWLRVQPGAVIVETELEVQVAEGVIDRLHVSADPRLRLLPLEGENPEAIVELDSPPEGPQTITFRWPEPVSQVGHVRARFLWTDTPGIGSLRLPLLAAQQARTIRRWVAASMDPALEYELEPGELWEVVEGPELLARWGLSGPPPAVAGRLPGDVADWSLTTRARTARTTAEQALVWTFDEGLAELTCSTRLNTVSGSRFAYRLSAPPGLEVTQVSVQETGLEQLARFAQHPDGTITVFLSAPASGIQQLVLKGRLRVPVRSRFTLPAVQLEGVDVERLTIELYRRSGVTAVVKKTEGLSALEGAAAGVAQARVVARYQAELPDSYECMVALSPNRPAVDAELITWIRPEGPQWSVRIDCRVQVADGALDRLSFGVPAQLTGPFAVEPEGRMEVNDLPDGKRVLLLWPEEPISGAFQYSLIGRLQRVEGQRLRAPKVTVHPARRLRRFVALPRQADGRALAWEVQGLRPAAPPTAVVAPQGFEPFTLYEVIDEAFDAVVRSTPSTTQSARVLLADIHLALHADGTYWSLVAFDLEPGGAAECPLWLPAEARLVHARVAGHAVAPRAVRANTWMLPLAASQLPQRVEVVSAGRLPEDSGEPLRFQLGNLPVAHTLWTVSEPAASTPGPLPASPGADAWRQEMVRLKTVAAVLQSGSRVVGDDPEQCVPWYELWAGRLVAARRAVERQLSLLSPGRQIAAAWQELRTIDREQTALAERLGTTEILMRVATHPQAQPQQWFRSGGARGPQRIRRFSFAGSKTAMSIEPPGSPSSGLPARVVAALAVVGLALGLVWAMRRGVLPWLVKKWPQPLLAGAGILWWLFLSPSVLGWLLIVAAVLSAVGPRFRRVQPEVGSSRIALDQLPR